MSTENTAGLSLQEAWAQAAAEEGLSGPASETTDIFPVEPDDATEQEQPNVESQEERGLFAALEDKGQIEQPEGDSYEVTVNGEKLLVSLDELRNGYQRQADYTRSKQELSVLRQEAEDALALKAALEANPQATVRALWEAANAGKPATQAVPQAPAAVAETDIDKIVEAKLQAMLASDPRVQELEAQRAWDEISLVFAQIEKDWGLESPLSLEDKEYIVNKAVEWNSGDIEAVFAKLMHQLDRKNKERENARDNSSASGYGGQGPAVVPAPKTNKRYGSFREAMNETFAEENVTQSELARAIKNL